MLLQRKNSPYWYVKQWQDGKNILVSTKCTSKRKAQAVHDEMKRKYTETRQRDTIAELLGEKIAERKPLLIKDAWEKYCSVNPNWSDSGRKIFKHFEETRLNLDIADIDADHALEFMKQYRDNKGKTFNTYKSALNQIWETLKAYSGIKENPWSKIMNMPVDSDYYRPITEKEYANILKHTNGFWHYAVIIAWHTGLRKKDIRKLKWEHIEQKAIDKIPEKTSYNKKAVFIPLKKEVLLALKSQKKSSQYVFPEYAAIIKSGAFDRQFTAILNSVKITAVAPAIVGFHSLRASFITRCLEQGISTNVIQGIVGHGSPLMTERYSHDKESAKAILDIS